MPDNRLSEAELYIMRFFWREGAMKTDTLSQLVQEKGWKPTTLLTFLSRLVQKGMLKAEKQGKANLYSPTVSAEEYQRREGTAFLNEMFGGSAKGFLAAMVDAGGISASEINDLKAWLDEQEVEA